MFSKRDRLRRRQDFVALSQSSRSVHLSHFIVLMGKISEKPGRFGVTVSKRVGNSVVRNRVKRFIREYIRLYLLPQNICRDVIIIAKPNARSLNGFSETLDVFMSKMIVWNQS